MSNFPIFDPKTPFSEEAEQALLGALMINPVALADVAAIVIPTDFYLLRHNRIYSALLRMRERNQAIDFVTLGYELQAMNALEDVGGHGYLIQLMNNTPTSVNATFYGGLVQRIATRRLYLEASDKIRAYATDETTDIEDVIQQVDNAVIQVASRHIEQRGGWVDDVLRLIADDLISQLRTGETPNLIKTGIHALDSLLLLEPEAFSVWAGRPSMGKSSMIATAILNEARRGNPVVWHSMEASAKQVTRRLLQMLTGISTQQQQRPRELDHARLALLQDAIVDLGELPIYIEDAPAPTPREILSKSEWLVRKHGVKSIFVDGIYRMQSDTNFHGDNVKRYGEIAERLKGAARRLRVPVIATHQLNREVEKRNDKRPMLSDLRESGRIEEEADSVLFFYRDEYYNPGTVDKGLAELIVAKQRDGLKAKVLAGFDAPRTRFTNVDTERVDLSDL